MKEEKISLNSFGEKVVQLEIGNGNNLEQKSS